MSLQPTTIYLERRSYRRRRLMDAARLLPVLGMLLFLVPLLWGSGEDETAATSHGLIYIFAIWALLIMVSAWMSRYLARAEADAAEQERRR
ncbi:MAG: hypothetical protein LJE68_04360 [Rhodobacter sp.]|nr:hypothetical protein [Rhodobacter sp.]